MIRKITIIAIGRMKQGAYAALAADYLKRLQAQVQIIEIPEAKTQPRPSVETAALLAKLADNAPVYLLDRQADSDSSTDFAARLQRHAEEAGHIQFIIGGAEGLDRDLCQHIPKLAFGTATWPHQLVRVMLLEQLYRAQCINSGHPYHK